MQRLTNQLPQAKPIGCNSSNSNYTHYNQYFGKQAQHAILRKQLIQNQTNANAYTNYHSQNNTAAQATACAHTRTYTRAHNDYAINCNALTASAKRKNKNSNSSCNSGNGTSDNNTSADIDGETATQQPQYQQKCVWRQLLWRS